LSVRVELLYFDGCPHYEALLPRLRELIGPEEELELRRIDSVEEAERERFLGSPSVRVNDHDVDPTASERDDFGLKCRLYRSDQGASGVPPEEWIRAALAEAE
jgi:hypothetical protein